MNNAIMADGSALQNPSNLVDSHSSDTFVSGRDLTAEEAERGYYHKGSLAVSDDELNNNPDIVIRNGMPQRAGGKYQPDDVLTFDGLEVTHDMAVSMGLIQSDGSHTSPQDDFMRGSENTDSAPEVEDTRPEEFQLVEAQVQVALGSNTDQAINTLSQDVAMNGELSEEGFGFAQRAIGMNAESVQGIIDDLTDAGGKVIHGFLEVGDDLGADRVAMLADIAENGSSKERHAIRSMWAAAATGKLTQDQAITEFDRIANEYE